MLAASASHHVLFLSFSTHDTKHRRTRKRPPVDNCAWSPVNYEITNRLRTYESFHIAPSLPFVYSYKFVLRSIARSTSEDVLHTLFLNPLIQIFLRLRGLHLFEDVTKSGKIRFGTVSLLTVRFASLPFFRREIFARR